MEIIEKLSCEREWNSFFDYKAEKDLLSEADIKDLRMFIDNREYIPVVENINSKKYLSIPKIAEINKKNTNKKRVVFIYSREENYVLKFIAYLLRQYDSLFADNLYSFRKNSGVKKAITGITAYPDLKHMASYKVDIHDYFNSVDTDIVMNEVRIALKTEPLLIELIDAILNNPYAEKENEIIPVKKGIMAGVPISGFLANLYLKDLDFWFYNKNIIYARYSDDIIVFSDNSEIGEYEKKIKSFLNRRGLKINEKKEKRTMPGETWEFLGFSFTDNVVDLSDAAIAKLKGKLKRKARSLYRWKIKKGASNERTAKAYIRFLNKKFYDNPAKNEITWCRWYFPVITTEKSLKILDDYAVDCIRYLYTGRYSKQNYNLKYSEIQHMGFRSLVNNYWRFKSGKYEI